MGLLTRRVRIFIPLFHFLKRHISFHFQKFSSNYRRKSPEWTRGTINENRRNSRRHINSPKCEWTTPCRTLFVSLSAPSPLMPEDTVFHKGCPLFLFALPRSSSTRVRRALRCFPLALPMCVVLSAPRGNSLASTPRTRDFQCILVVFSAWRWIRQVRMYPIA